MKCRPILFSGPMVRALLDGRKTQTRRVLKSDAVSPDYGDIEECSVYPGEFYQWGNGTKGTSFLCPYGQPGDLLWVRETWARHYTAIEAFRPHYRADLPEDADAAMTANHAFGLMEWKPSIFMPRTASRLTLEITGVRVERLQDISRQDAASEGVCLDLDKPLPDWCKRDRWPEENYQTLWESINGAGSWTENPWVWVLEFKVHRCNVDDMLKARAA